MALRPRCGCSSGPLIPVAAEVPLAELELGPAPCRLAIIVLEGAKIALGTVRCAEAGKLGEVDLVEHDPPNVGRK